MAGTNNGTVTSDPDTWSAGEVLEVSYTMLTFILGFGGNLFVVITSHLYHSIDLDAVTIVLVRQLAVADLLLILNTVLPTVITMFSGGWVLGNLICDITGHFNFIPVMVNIYLVLSLSIFKILTCKMPFRMRDVTTKHAWLMVLVSYLLAAVEFFESVFLAKSGMYAPPVSRCLSKIYVTNPTLMLWNAAIPVGLPILGIVFCNAWIYIVARKVIQARGQGSHSRALLTICAVSGLFVLSWTPKLIYVTMVTITKQQIPWAVKISHFFPFINSVGNPIIYTFTNKRYGEFVYNLFIKFKITAAETSHEVISKIASELKSSHATGSPKVTAKYHRVLGEEARLAVQEESGGNPVTQGASSTATLDGRTVTESERKEEKLPLLMQDRKYQAQNEENQSKDELKVKELNDSKKPQENGELLLEIDNDEQQENDEQEARREKLRVNTGKQPESGGNTQEKRREQQSNEEGLRGNEEERQQNKDGPTQLLDNGPNTEGEEELGVYIVDSSINMV